jgi:hypothetical protein
VDKSAGKGTKVIIAKRYDPEPRGACPALANFRDTSVFGTEIDAAGSDWRRGW